MSFLLCGRTRNIWDVASVLTGRPPADRALNPRFPFRAFLRVRDNLFTRPALNWLFRRCSSFLLRWGPSFEYSSLSSLHIKRAVRYGGGLLIRRLKMRHFHYFGSRWRFLKKRFNLAMQEIVLITLIKYTPIKPKIISIEIFVIPRSIVKHQHHLFPGGQRLHRITWLQIPYWFLGVVLLLKNQLVDCENSCVSRKQILSSRRLFESTSSLKKGRLLLRRSRLNMMNVTRGDVAAV